MEWELKSISSSVRDKLELRVHVTKTEIVSILYCIETYFRFRFYFLSNPVRKMAMRIKSTR